MKNNQRLLFLVEVSMLASLAFLLDLVSGVVGRFWPQGGSISLAMIPIFILSFRWGLKGGLLAGFLLGLLQVVLGTAFIAHPVQAFIDYFFAFTVVGLSGILFKQVQHALVNRKKGTVIAYVVLGTFIGSALRYLAHVIAGVYFFAEYTPEGTPIWTYSIVYNGSYMLPTFIVSAIVTALILITAPRLVTRNKTT
ncbi:energy-coupled thiamine transporter ThiT [Metabacillus herbersteinensis]|uniref:Energy-coupled thiamine transporter ThiT n=1 Tax=Metabacillus herbersteinensis TaxID=283816 RepID=A0ABV6GBV9_9BACI